MFPILKSWAKTHFSGPQKLFQTCPLHSPASKPLTDHRTGLRCDSLAFFFILSTSSCREQPIFSARAHVFQIDPNTKRNWIPASKHAVSVSFFYDANRNVYRIISVGGTKVSFDIRMSSGGSVFLLNTVKVAALAQNNFLLRLWI